MIKEELEKFGFFTYKHANEKFNELKEQFMEMSQLKSDYDIEKMTIRKEGNFIAHNFHFLMRQYSLALSEARRMLLEKEETERKILELQEDLKNDVKKKIIYTREGKQEEYTDIYLRKLINRLDGLEISIVNKIMSIRGFEACRLALIELNGGTPPTNKQYQDEEPKYWEWFLTKKALQQSKQRLTGIEEGVWDNIDYLESKPIINDNFQRKVLTDKGMINLDKANADIELRKLTNNKEYNNITKKLISNGFK